jgi:hypothetical protein
MAANDTIKVYNADEVVVTLGPAIIDSGFGEDTFVEIAQATDDTEDAVGVDGEVTVSRTNDRRADVTFTLMQTSDHNDTLSVLSNLARNAPGMTGAIQPFVIKDLNGRALYTGQNAWVAAPPPVTYGRKATERAWKIRVANLVRVDGGN